MLNYRTFHVTIKDKQTQEDFSKRKRKEEEKKGNKRFIPRTIHTN